MTSQSSPTDKPTWWQSILENQHIIFFIGGMIFFILGAVSSLDIKGVSLKITDPFWRYAIAVVGLALIGVGIYFYAKKMAVSDIRTPAHLSKPAKDKKSHIQLLSAGTKTTRLIPHENGLELEVHDSANEAQSMSRFLPADKLSNILRSGNLINVAPESRKGINFGQISFGPWKHWLYSKDDHSNPQKLQNDIVAMARGIVQENNL